MTTRFDAECWICDVQQNIRADWWNTLVGGDDTGFQNWLMRPENRDQYQTWIANQDQGSGEGASHGDLASIWGVINNYRFSQMAPPPPQPQQQAAPAPAPAPAPTPTATANPQLPGAQNFQPFPQGSGFMGAGGQQPQGPTMNPTEFQFRPNMPQVQGGLLDNTEIGQAHRPRNDQTDYVDNIDRSFVNPMSPQELQRFLAGLGIFYQTGPEVRYFNGGGLASLAAPGPNYYGGGAIYDPQHPQAPVDTVPARLQSGEFVMTRKAVQGAGNGDPAEGARRLYSAMRAWERKAK